MDIEKEREKNIKVLRYESSPRELKKRRAAFLTAVSVKKTRFDFISPIYGSFENSRTKRDKLIV